jgi:DNA-directed RNA polymerase subunit L/DNA-directed RNA polymerase alpha subunit
MTDTNLKIKIPDTKETETSGSPGYDPKSDKYGPTTPEGGPKTPDSAQYSPTGSPGYDPNSGKYSPTTPDSAQYSPTGSPGYDPESGKYGATTPDYDPDSPYTHNFGLSSKFNDTYKMDNMIKYVQNNNFYKFSFDLHDVPVAYANALRRAFSSLCPTVAFNDDYESKSIVINKNTSALHNEFLSHRISLIPINMDDTSAQLQFNTKFNEETGKREYFFKDEKNVPSFEIKAKNDSEASDLRDQKGLLNIKSSDFKIKQGEQLLENETFFKKDPFTDDHIVINKLKSNISNDKEGEEIDLICIPQIGIGRTHSRHDPTGTVTYSFEIDKEETCREVFNQKIDILQKERTNKGLNELSKKEIEKLQRSFNLLDKQRVYKKDTNGEPNHFKFSVESIGFLNPLNIMVNSIKNLILNLTDVRAAFTFEKNSKGILTLKVNKKIELSNNNNLHSGICLKIKDENHTLGNLLQYYLRKDHRDKYLDICEYLMPHPTIENIEFRLVPKKFLTKEHFINNIDEYSNIKKYLNVDETKIVHIYLCKKFIQSITHCINELNEFLKILFELQGQIKFRVDDDDSYLNKNMGL